MSIFVPHTERPQFLLKALVHRIRSGVYLGWLACLTISLAPSICAQEQVDVAVVVDGAVVDGAVVDGPVVDGAVEPAVQNDPQLWLLSSYARVNSALARRACELTEAEEQQLALINDDWISQQMRAPVNAVAEGVAAGVALFLRGAPVMRNLNRGEQPHQLVERVRKAIDEQIEQALSEEHRHAYRIERNAREEFRRQSQASVMVAALDERVYLSTEQRQRLEAELAQSAMKDLYWQFYFQNQSYIPDLPKDMLNKVLTKEQLEVLKGSQTHRFELAQIELQLIQEKPIVIER